MIISIYDYQAGQVRLYYTSCRATDWPTEDDLLQVTLGGDEDTFVLSSLRLYARDIEQLFEGLELYRPVSFEGAVYSGYLELFGQRPQAIQQPELRKLLLLKKALELATLPARV